jgi:hypothetical protein
VSGGGDFDEKSAVCGKNRCGKPLRLGASVRNPLWVAEIVRDAGQSEVNAA